MINISDKHDCCGCSACASICPKECVLMVVDNEGFLYPQVNADLCIDCGLCEKVCNVLHPNDKLKPLRVLAAINKDEKIRLKSSSGGIFYLIAKKTINEGGVVFGARFDENWQVIIDYADDMKGIEAFMGSKYVQARIDKAYIDVKRFLTLGRKVLFSGTPCQVAGLHKFLRKPYENLLTIDFVCHGTPSPKVWRMYIEELIISKKSVKSISFRNKTNGWRHLYFSVDYDDNMNVTSIINSAYENQYMKAFLADLTLRPSCYSCAAKSCSSLSDITLADFWGIWNVNPELNDNKGTSMLFINTQKGENALPEDEQVKYANSDYETAQKYNKACEISVTPNPKRETFFIQLQDTQSVTRLIDKILQPPFFKRNLKTFRTLINYLLK